LADRVVARLADESDEVKAEALKLLAGFGPDAAGAIPAVAGLLEGKAPEAVKVRAVDTLARLGPKAVDPLTKALGEKLSKDVQGKVCEALGGFGPAARGAGPAMLRLVAAGPAGPADAIAAAVAKVGGDEAAEQLAEWTRFEARTVNGRQVDKKAKYGDARQMWAIRVLGSLDPASLSEGERRRVAERLAYLARWDPDIACREAARQGQVLYPPPKK
jgi:hypothetical protein